jgi:ERO1-like protein alpha
MRLFSFFLLFTFVSFLPFFSCVPLSDCCCDSEFLTNSNSLLNSHLVTLRSSLFFRTFRVNLHQDCPFWREFQQCGKKSCSVCGECQMEELPEPWRESLTSPAIQAGLGAHFRKWEDNQRDQWVASDSATSIVFINMLLNPETWTGYGGPSAHKIWHAVYEENCFPGAVDSLCYEERVMYRLLSGLHASISSHISYTYPLDDTELESEAAPNTAVFDDKLGHHPERIENLQFALAIVLRAVNKATPLLLNYSYETGHLEEDNRVKHQVKHLLTSTIISQCHSSTTFDETKMFVSPEGKRLKASFRDHFRNISRIMNCVSCEKCRLHGKLLTLGVGTALKILFEDSVSKVNLQRNEVMSLIAALGKLSGALEMVREMQNMKWKAEITKVGTIAAVTFTILCFIGLLIKRCLRSEWKNTDKIKVN